MDKFEPLQLLHAEPVLLIDDTWTTGTNAQSAAATLKRAGAGPIAAVPIGRHLNRDWHKNDGRLRGISRPFDWRRCALCAESAHRTSDLRRSPRASPAPPRSGR